jgi:hypothetical protein
MPLHDEKIGVWVGMSPRRIVGSIIFSETLNPQRYCDNIVYSFIAQLKEDEIDRAYFHQDGATAYTAHMSMAHLDDVFGDRIIWKNIWPPKISGSFSARFFSLGCDEKLSALEQYPHNSWVEECHHKIHSECVPCYTEHGLREHSSMCQ